MLGRAQHGLPPTPTRTRRRRDNAAGSLSPVSAGVPDSPLAVSQSSRNSASAPAHAPTQARPCQQRRLVRRMGVGPHARIDRRVLRRHGALHQGGGELQRAGSNLCSLLVCLAPLRRNLAAVSLPH